MRKLPVPLLLAAAISFSAPPSNSTAEPIQPAEEVRALARVQDGLGNGKQGSIALQRLLVSRISKQFRRAPSETWSKRRNAIAAIKYLVSGGNPSFADGDAVVLGMPESLNPLFLASRAYAKGQVAEAARRFAKINPREVDPSLGGHVALIKSLSISAKDQAGALRLLDDARLLGVGTLVEEAALRRQIGVLVHQAPRQLFQRLSLRYVRRFQKSFFASAFRQHLATGLTHPSFKLDENRKVWLEALFDHLDRAVRPAYCMAIAERALVLGRADLVHIATLRAQADVIGNPEVGARARLFHAAIAITGEEHAAALETLRKSIGFLPNSFEGGIREAALEIAKGIARPVEVNSNAENAQVGADTSKKGGEIGDDMLSSVSRAAMTAIRVADQHLAN